MINDLAIEWPDATTTPTEATGGLDDAAEHGQPDPTAPPMALPDVLNSLITFLERFIVFPTPSHPVVISLWIAHTWVIDAFDYTPYLHVLSPEKRCGKSRLMECLQVLCSKPWLIVSPTAAVLFRKIEQDAPSLLLDEVDTVFVRGSDEGKEAIRGVLNAGFQRDGKIPRCAGDNHELREFRVFCPKALAGIGKIPETVADRCIPIQLARKTGGQPVERFRGRDVREDAQIIVDSLEVWRDQPGVLEALRSARPCIPDAFGDRQADICEPLLAIGDSAGVEWGDRATRAVIALCGDASSSDDSLGVKLLCDIRRVFENDRGDRILSYELVSHLTQLDTDAPWALWWQGDLGGNGLAVTGKLARRLKPYGISPQTIRMSPEQTAKGYLRSYFEDAWTRYCPPLTVETVTP